MCELCLDKRDTLKLTSPSQWKSPAATTYMVSLHPSVLHVCQACRRDLSIVLANDSYVPRWQKISERENKECSVKTCDGKVFASLHNDDIMRAFGLCELEPIHTVPTPTPFCKHHYHNYCVQHSTSYANTVHNMWVVT